jgi:hypothetical protein
MRSALRPLVCVVAGAALVAGLLCLQTFARAQQRLSQLEVQDRNASQRLAARAQLIHALIDGQISLREAVAHFGILNEQDASVAAAVPLTYPAASLDASLCLQVLAWTDATVGAEQQTAVTVRLNEEAAGILSPR